MAGPIVILGAGGMLGTAFRQLAPTLWERDGERARFFDRSACDVTDATSIRDAIAPGVSLVVNCAAYTDVDKAESDEAGALALNARAPGLIAERCMDVGATLVHFSTDYVFPGDADRPYGVDEPRRPLGAYGRSKARGEEAVERAFSAWRPGAPGGSLIIRTSWLYAPHAKNFVRTIARASRERPTLRVVSDQRGRPTSCRTLAEAAVRLAATNERGAFHVSDAGECTWFDLATAVARRANPACRVDPCTTSEYPRPARRPAYSVLDLSRTENLIGPMPDWRVSLDAVLTKMEGQGWE